MCMVKINGINLNVEMQYSGHIPMSEEPEIYNNLIDKFLSE